MQPTLDEAWFDRYNALKVAIGDAYEILEPLPKTVSDKRQEFEASHYTKNISLLSDRVNIESHVRHLSEIERLEQDINDNESNELLREVYLDAVRDLKAIATMAIAGSTGNKADYDAANRVVYNAPDEHVFKAACHWIRTNAERSAAQNPELSILANRVLELIPNLQDNHQMLVPGESVFRKVRKLHRENGGYYEQLFGKEGLPQSSYVTQVEGDDICRQVLSNIGSRWTVAPSQNNLWAVMRSRKELVSPVGYRLERDEFIGIVCHEIGSHILEEVNGEKQKLRLLGTGLSGFENGNEGRAFLREQIVYDSEHTFLNQFAWEYIVLLHVSTSLANGIYKEPYTFAKLYETLYALYSFWREKRMPHATSNDQFAHEEAWYLAVRIMKGTDGLGGGYMKDSVYLEGNIRCWQLAENDPAMILFGDEGMFDVTNPRHVEIVRSLEASA